MSCSFIRFWNPVRIFLCQIIAFSQGSLQGVQLQGLESAVAALEQTELNEEQASELQDLKKHIEQLKKLQSSLDYQNETWFHRPVTSGSIGWNCSLVADNIFGRFFPRKSWS